MSQQPQQHKPQKPKQKKESKTDQYIRYSSVSFQAMGTILLAVWGGQQLDQYFGLEKPIITALLAFLAVLVSIYLLVREFLHK